MICIRLQGGLGNQLFQYAAARALADYHGTQVRADLNFLQKRSGKVPYTFREYGLHDFHVSLKPLDLWQQIALGIRSVPYQRIFKQVINKVQPYRMYEEQSLLYDPLIQQKTSRNSYLNGYFQSEKYFNAIEPMLRKDLQFRFKVDNSHSEKIRQSNAVSLHIRRGDYVSDPGNLCFHGICPLSYYDEALQYIAARHAGISVFVFSDDISWAKQHLPYRFPVYFMEHPVGRSGAYDLQLMSLCRFHIIANSSFSWWGAWLNSNPEKIVIAPNRWFASDHMEQQAATLLPDKWIRI